MLPPQLAEWSGFRTARAEQTVAPSQGACWCLGIVGYPTRVQGVLSKVGSSGSANLEMAFPGLLLSQTQRAFPVLLQTRRTEQEVLPRSTAKRMNNANEQCVLLLNSPQAVGSPPENNSLEKHPKRGQPGQADLLRWHRSRAKISEEGRAGSAALQSRHRVQPCGRCSQQLIPVPGEPGKRSSSSWGAQLAAGEIKGRH